MVMSRVLVILALLVFAPLSHAPERSAWTVNWMQLGSSADVPFNCVTNNSGSFCYPALSVETIEDMRQL